MKGRIRKPSQPRSRTPGRMLLVVDDSAWRILAWERLSRARRRLTKATAELHRHEEKDEPAYRRWMFASCPALLSEIRELTGQCQSKSGLLAQVETRARREGRPPAVVWQLYKNQILSADDLAAEAADEAELDGVEDEDGEAEQEDRDQIINEFLRDEGIDPWGPEAERMRDLGRAFRRRAPPNDPGEAKEVYRRLVQRLHPDRGGEWSSQRATLWHEVQRAWEARDADWLSRLEAESEIASEVLSASSALGRLYIALTGIEAARRDTERKLRQYQKTPAWRFTLEARDAGSVGALEVVLRDERDHLRIHLATMEATLLRWEKPLGQARAQQRNAAKLHPMEKTHRRMAEGRRHLDPGPTGNG